MTAVPVSSGQPFENYFHSVVDGGKKMTNLVGESLRDLLTYATHIKDDVSAHTHLWKSIPAGLTALGKESSLLLGPAGSAVRFLEGWQLLGDIGDFMGGKMNDDPWIQVAQRVFFAFSNLGTTVVWAVELGVVSLGTGIVSTFAGLSTGGATVGFGIGAVGALYTLATLDDHKYRSDIRNKAILDIIANVSGAALTAIAFAGATLSPVTIALLILASSGFGILSFCYSKKYPKAFYQDKNDVQPSFWTKCSDFVYKTEGLEKIAKLFNKLAEGASELSVINLVKESKCFVEFHEVLNFPKNLFFWFVPSKVKDAQGNTVKDAFGNAKMEYAWDKISAWKTANKVFLTALSIITVLSFTIKYKLAEFSFLTALAAATIGGVSFLAFAAAATFFGYTSCGFVDNAVLLADEYKTGAPLNSAAKADVEAWKKAEKKKMFNVEKKIAKWKEVDGNLSQSKSALDKQTAENDVALSRSKRSRKLPTDAAKTALKAMSVQAYTKTTLNRLETRYKNADTRCKRAGLNIITDGSKAAGGAIFLTSMFVAASLSAPVVAGMATA
ncbi:MAG: hypothetical protein H0U49_09895, partial [Parachlamydiaceae bacterium]|nr:hypothetical protein [Parachlamydiaceae bacterium]